MRQRHRYAASWRLLWGFVWAGLGPRVVLIALWQWLAFKPSPMR